MRFDRIRLSNFKCYGDADLRLNAGVTVIHGLNGSGKSSLLEACFFALYGSKALDTNLGDVVTIGADDTEVELWFTHGGDEFHVERRVRATGEQPTTAKCVLEAPDVTVEGARDVRAYVQDLLRMDAEAFVNCAYVRQGEVNKLINASPDQRQDMIDSLLQLGKLEDYRERASEARLGVKRVRDEKRGELSGLDGQIEEKEDEDLHEQLNALESELGEVQSKIENLDEQREAAVETRDQAEEVLEAYEENREELETLESKIEALREQISETEREREELSERIDDLEDEREETQSELADLLTETDLDVEDPDDVSEVIVEDRLDDLANRAEELRDAMEDERVAITEYSGKAETAREQAETNEEEAAEARQEADDLEEEVAEARETLDGRREKLTELDETVEELQTEFEDLASELDDPVAFGVTSDRRESVADELGTARERIAQLETEVETQREAIEEAEELLEAGKCPECGQDVDGAPHVETIDDDREELTELESDLETARETREELADRLDRLDRLVDLESEVESTRTDRENVAQLIEEREATLDEKVEQVEALRAEAEELVEAAEEKREEAEEWEEKAAESREALGTINEEHGEVKQARQRLERVADLLDAIADLTDDVADCREEREQLAEFNDERREQLVDKRERRDALEEEFDEERVETAREELDRAETYLEKVEPKLESLRERRDELQGQIGAVENEIEELESLRERRADLAETVEHLESLYDEAEQLQGMYGNLRADLRQRNVRSLEAMLNEIFDLVYQNNSYDRIELSGEYELTVYQKDGEELDPEQLSGGERALFNLSLRCAIYRLLAEGIEGAAPMPPFILDEPTVFLDSGHVSQLVELVEAMRDYGVEQILVVSHDEELVAAAEDLVRVSKDARTNRSTVTREDPAEQLLKAD